MVKKALRGAGRQETRRKKLVDDLPVPSRELSGNERDNLKRDMELAAQQLGGVQQKMLQEDISVAFTGRHLNGDDASRSARTTAMAALRTRVPEKVLEKISGVADTETKILEIRFGLAAMESSDPSVKKSDLEDLFDTVDLPPSSTMDATNH